jgi:transposase-like protein
MECPNCKSNNVVKLIYTNPIHNDKGELIGYEPQFTCYDCNHQWDILSRRINGGMNWCNI